MLDLSRARERMVDVQIARRGVRDRRVLDAMRRVPREVFVEPGLEESPTRTGRYRLARARRSRSPTSSRS
jgi:protein-L-isoaspartate O-methyltransferase